MKTAESSRHETLQASRRVVLAVCRLILALGGVGFIYGAFSFANGGSDWEAGLIALGVFGVVLLVGALSPARVCQRVFMLLFS